MNDNTYLKPKIRQYLKVMKKNYPTLYSAWQLFTRFDKHAKRLKFWMDFLHTAALVLGVITPVLVIYDLYWGDQTSIFQYVLIGLPVLLSVLLVYTSRLGRSGKWFILRAAAEHVKREIYSYRVGAGSYADPKTKDEQLANRLEALYRWLMDTKANSLGLAPYDDQKDDLPPDMDDFSKGDDGHSPISAGEYFHFRVETQIEFTQERVDYSHKRMQLINIFILLAGVIGTFLAAVGLALWVVVTTTVVLALMGYIEYNQMGKSLTASNQTLANLEAIKIWWAAQDEVNKETPEIRDMLVTKAEDVLNAKLLRWIQTEEIEWFEEQGAVITDGAYYGPTDGPDSAAAASYEEPRDISPSELVTMSPGLEEKFPLGSNEAGGLEGDEKSDQANGAEMEAEA